MSKVLGSYKLSRKKYQVTPTLEMVGIERWIPPKKYSISLKSLIILSKLDLLILCVEVAI